MHGTLIAAILVLSLLGMPIGYALGSATLLALLYAGSFPLILIPQQFFAGIDSFPIMAIPFFILAGNLMTAGGINQKLIRFCNTLVGWVPGSLAMVTVVASMFFAAISGSAVATVAAIGGITIPAMKQENYPPGFAVAVAASSGVCGPVIPPSICLIVYGAALSMSIGDLFLASVIPGLLLGGVLCLTAYVISKRRNFPRHERAPKGAARKAAGEGIWALIMPFAILGAIFSGIVTPTEASVLAVLYALVVGIALHRDLRFSEIHPILCESAIATATILFILAASKASSWVIVTSRFPEILSSAILDLTRDKFLILLLVNVLLLIVGMLMEANAALVILIPILVPLVNKVGVSSLQFGVIMSFNLCLGLLTPPVGAALLLGNDIAGERIERSLIETIPFFLAGLTILFLITYLPGLSLWLPQLFR
ncbi:TRAP transporter large permease [Fretibacterium sp. OH1220_COT-178]|uniref:TRAP transporter large permease n=1 Tax=Fretibacterium sp. OH1220_COT-178 TaxID=2491047 RepID=UPI000F5DE1F6|nr:TRAP transporter large permease [Fretibacterium sp. OH1220_COT-178]RRD63257.1 TRAP transporter large permease [Fretibacterium sp. OH1220_COT-178]